MGHKLNQSRLEMAKSQKIRKSSLKSRIICQPSKYQAYFPGINGINQKVNKWDFGFNKYQAYLESTRKLKYGILDPIEDVEKAPKRMKFEC